MMEKILEIVEKVIPPSEGDKHVRTWRMVIAGLTLMNAAGLTAHILLACGYIPFYPGFAQAGEIDNVKKQMQTDAAAIKGQLATFEWDQKQRRISALKKDILDLQAKRCAAPAGPAKQLYLTSIQEALVEYQNLENKPYPLPGCESF